MPSAPPTVRRREQEVLRGTAKQARKGLGRFAVLRLITDWSYATRVVRYLLGLPVPMHTEDRRVLEQIIFPYFLRLPDTRRVLFVGCDWYTKHYERAFFADREYWTLDISEKARKFGGTRHIVAGMQNLGTRFAAGYFDLIVCNGVYGFGLDTVEECNLAIDAACTGVRDGGYFVFGWDDIPERTPVPLESIAALAKFERFAPARLGFRYLSDTPYRHTYEFFRKPAIARESPRGSG